MVSNTLNPPTKLTNLFTDFFNSERSGGLVLIACAVISIIIANFSEGEWYTNLWHSNIFSKPIEFWINDGLMTIFFLLVGLEIEREIYIGELSTVRKSMLPVIAAIGGMIIPAIIHFAFNNGTIYQNGFGIPMATDIAFSLAILSFLGNRVPAPLKVFLTALAIIDDLGAIIIIALFYSANFSWLYLSFATLIFGGMLVLNRLKFYGVWVYLILGCAMWFCLYRSGIHPTITGVFLAFAIPFGNGDENSPSYKLQQMLHKPVAFIILPLFALANTAILIPSSVVSQMATSNNAGIITGLLLGKPLGILLFPLTGIAIGICSLPDHFKRRHLLGAGFLAGIGFTMSIFITLLAFNDRSIIDNSKVAVMVASFIAGLVGYLFLYFTLPKQVSLH